MTADLALLTEKKVAVRAAGRERTSALARVAAWGALIALFAFTLEATCRIEDWVRYRTPLFSPIISQSDLIVRDADGVHGRPNARFQKWVMNALGTRGPEASLVKRPGTQRVVAIGASETFGLYESPGKEYPRQLEDTLNRRLARDACTNPEAQRFEVLNAGMPGMSLPTIEQDVRNRVRRFGADFIVLYPTPAQYLTDDAPRPTPPDSARGAGDLSRVEMLHPRIVARLRNQLKDALPEFVKTWMRRRETENHLAANPPGWRFTSVPAERLTQYEADLRSLIGAVRSTGAVPVVATHANAFMQRGFNDRDLLLAWERFYPRAPGRVIVAFDSAARAVTLRVAIDSSARVVDLAARLSSESGSVFSDFAHFTDRGAAIVADVLAPPILAAVEARAGCGT